MEKRECKICKVEKSLESFYRCKNCIGGRIGVCKICKQKGLNIPKDKVHPFNQMWRKPESDFFSLNRVRKKDYELMWELLSEMGYDTSKDVHSQFMEKVNSQTNKPIKVKRKIQSNMPKWLPNGELNLELKKNQKKTPNE